MCDTPSGGSLDYECLKTLVGQVVHIQATLNSVSVEGRVERVGENWVIVVDKKDARHIVNTKYIMKIVQKP